MHKNNARLKLMKNLSDIKSVLVSYEELKDSFENLKQHDDELIGKVEAIIGLAKSADTFKNKLQEMLNQAS